MISRAEAYALVEERIPQRNLVNHCVATELIMRALAEHLALSETDADRWALTGLLHDLDYAETADDPARHGLVSADELAGLVDERIIHAILAHAQEAPIESDMIRRALDALPLDELDLIIVENVGNLVCPTDFYLGENAKVMILSVPEGHDKPYKYPGIFQISEAVILNKVDTMPVFDFNEEEFNAEVHTLNPKAPIFRIAATKGEGVSEWAEWLAARIDAAKAAAAEKKAAGASE